MEEYFQVPAGFMVNQNVSKYLEVGLGHSNL